MPVVLGDLQESVFTFRDGYFLRTVGSSRHRGTYKVSLGRKPAHLDEYYRSEKGTVWHNIYQVEGDTLKIAYLSMGGWDGRPESFSDSDIFIITYKRQPK